MLLILKKLIFTSLFNFVLFLILMIGTQNSTNKKNINLIFSESVNLPVGFIVGISFIAGSLSGNVFNTNLSKKE